MVLKKRLDYGFNGYQVPVIPRGPRSVRRRFPPKKILEDSKICAFELLAAVAGKLLQESESSASSNAAEEKDPSGIHCGEIKQELLEGGKALRSECLDQGSCIESAFVSGLPAQKSNLKTTLREFPHSVCDTALGSNSVISSSDFFKKGDAKLEIAENQTVVEKLSCKVEGRSSDCGRTWDSHVNSGIERQLIPEENHNRSADLTAANTFCLKDPMETHVNTHPLTNSDSSVQLTSYRDCVPNTYFRGHGNNVKVDSKVDSRDDDENSIGGNRPCSNMRAFRSQPRAGVGHRRIRKLLTSKYWKVAPKLKDCEYYNSTDGSMKRVSRNRKTLHNSERIHHGGPFKKRRLYEHSSILAYDREESSESISNSPEKGMKGDKSSAVKSHRASGVSSPVVGCHASFQSRDSHVKFSIKSFKVPELYIEVPETATIGSLKRTVMEAVTAILQGGLHVGVLLRDKKIKDDSRTLLQTGICHKNDLDTLGFTLEPTSAIASPPVSPKDPPVLLPCETHHQLSRSAASPVLDLAFTDAPCDLSPVANVDSHVESKHEPVPSSIDAVTDGPVTDSKALVVIPAMNSETLAVVPVNQKSKRPELVQRRIRRPFSVSEVEALVEAVEKLGTGRWRDVKLCAFENADHRTYVDLKDKWKTLVHTASISPQQRRGEPVPQELLDRVLAAHAYWSQHQSKQHCKHQPEPLQIAKPQVGGV